VVNETDAGTFYANVIVFLDLKVWACGVKPIEMEADWLWGLKGGGFALTEATSEEVCPVTFLYIELVQITCWYPM